MNIVLYGSVPTARPSLLLIHLLSIWDYMTAKNIAECGIDLKS